jgi:hypothetical protein
MEEAADESSPTRKLTFALLWAHPDGCVVVSADKCLPNTSPGWRAKTLVDETP